MSIFTKIGNFMTDRRLRKLERDLHMLESRIKFEPKYSKLAANVFNADKFTRKITEYLVWYNGDVEVIRSFFTDGGHLSSDTNLESNLFWESAPNDYRFVHSGVPALISTKMATILFGKGFTYDVSVMNADGTENKNASEDAYKVIEKLVHETNFEQFMIESAASASWGGHVFPKLSYDLALSPFPILESVDIRNGIEVKKRRLTQGIVFRTWYDKKITDSKTIKYRLDEIYRTANQEDLSGNPEEGISGLDGEIGDALIEYRLFMLDERGNDVEVPLNAIEDTSDIIMPKVLFKGLKGILALGVPNRLPNNDFIDSPFGASDYSHSTTAFDALDEVMSEMARETRDNKAIRLWPASLLPKDTDGRIMGPNAFVRNILKYQDDLAEGAENSIDVQTIEDKTESLITKYKQAIATACNNAGISPLALGITGLESVSAGENSQRERNKATLETRNLKLQIWGPALEKLLSKMLRLYAWMGDNLEIEKDPLLASLDDLSAVKISVHFPDYIIASDSENIDTWGKAVSMKVADTQTAVEQIYADRTKEEQLEIATRIRFEQGVSADNPNALQLNDLVQPQPDTTQTP